MCTGVVHNKSSPRVIACKVIIQSFHFYQPERERLFIGIPALGCLIYLVCMDGLRLAKGRLHLTQFFFPLLREELRAGRIHNRVDRFVLIGGNNCFPSFIFLSLGRVKELSRNVHCLGSLSIFFLPPRPSIVTQEKYSLIRES